jgi:hypothetical protein
MTITNVTTRCLLAGWSYVTEIIRPKAQTVVYAVESELGKNASTTEGSDPVYG